MIKKESLATSFLYFEEFCLLVFRLLLSVLQRTTYSDSQNVLIQHVLV